MASTPKAFAGQDFNFDPLGLAVKCATRRSELVGPGDFWGSFFWGVTLWETNRKLYMENHHFIARYINHK
jgi:hypothetical protein